MIVGIEESWHAPSDAMHNPSQPFELLSSLLSRRYTRYLLTSHSKIVDIEKVTDIDKKTKTKPNWTKPSTLWERARDYEPDGAFIFYWAGLIPFIW
ncbi:hypothetical protein Tco_1435299, partial [Tanacetum coccineum]